MLFVPKLLKTTFQRGKYFNAGKSEVGVMSTMRVLTIINTLKISFLRIIFSVYCVKVRIFKYHLKFHLKIISTKPNQNVHHIKVVLFTFGFTAFGYLMDFWRSKYLLRIL